MMTDTLLVQLNPAQVAMDPGGPETRVTITIHNLGAVVDQYSVEVTGLDAEWFSAPLATVGLFPQDHEEVPFALHPPKRPGVQKGRYPFRVLVRSRGGAAQAVADGVLELTGVAVYRLEVAPRRQSSHGEGTFQVQLANTGTADVRLALEARDAEDGCRFRFPRDDTPLVAAGSKTDVPLRVRPRKRRWVGPDQVYDFTVSARPRDAAGDPQSVAGQFTYQPRFASWAPLRTAVLWLLALCVVLAVGGVLVSSGVVREFPQRTGVALGVVRGTACRVPVLNGMCGAEILPKPALNPQCSYLATFKDYADAAPELVGDCTTDVAYDGFGNAVQHSRNGVLLWQKDADTVYFFRDDRLYIFADGTPHVLRGPDAR